MSIKVRSIMMVLFAALALPLTACDQPGTTTWKVVGEGEIVAMDSVNLVFIRGGLNSKSVIDYQYAYRTKDGGYRQRMVSDVWREVTRIYTYPGSEAVTIYEDATGDVKPRIVMYMCSTEEVFTRCTMPDGKTTTSAYRIDFHVPPGTVVEEK